LTSTVDKADVELFLYRLLISDRIQEALIIFNVNSQRAYFFDFLHN